ncbi:TIGR02391 family protein [Rhodovulum viride]|uniref:TIGR02391 family protein n=1 Tax=Rhodovulum viride TaxID=1231134 RepID=A0ABX9DHT4_9RHOB|nr:TIGR02391 family protein [Rhodovulum viride]RAP41937.1 TIGR02391 family protein [Rhodovulum viride]
MLITDLFPDPEVLIALEPDELGMRLLPLFSDWHRRGDFHLGRVLERVNGRPSLPGQPTVDDGQYERRYKPEIDEALREAWAWLVGAALLIPDPRYHALDTTGPMRFSRKARSLTQDPNHARARSTYRLPKDALPPSIREEVWDLYHRGKFATAVFTAMRGVEIAVREGAGFPVGDHGVPMIRRAFQKDTGPLRDPDQDEGEREALMHLFAGAIGPYKNPHSHRAVEMDDPGEAIEIVTLASHMLRIVDARRSRRLENS